MNIAEVEAVLKRVTYKPGWRFTVLHPTPYDQPPPDGMHPCVIVTTVDVRDARLGPDHGKPNRIQSAMEFDLASIRDEVQLVQRLRYKIHAVEQHEADEWLRLDGKLLHDPHA